MKQESFSSIEDFVFDPTFRDWLLDNNSSHKNFWEKWMAANPEKVPVLNYAKAIVYALTVNHRQLSEEEIQNEIKQIMRKTASSNPVSSDPEPPVKPGRSIKLVFKKLAVAAALVGIAIFSFFYFRSEAPPKTAATDFYSLPGGNSSSVVEQFNNSDSVQLVNLFDGSRVQLYPKSKLSFSHSSFSKKREIYLTGEAFFDVTKNPSVPFIVYTKNLVTKVLGTSFSIKAYPGEKKALVEVKTGKVSVYRKENFSEKNAVANKLDGLIVIPNQQVIYDAESNQLRKTIIDEPVAITGTPSQTFVFNSTPLKEVFKTLQNTYGITIIYDESVINSCSLSASMGEESFYEKLELICKALDASYESIDGTIYFSSQGCN